MQKRFNMQLRHYGLSLAVGAVMMSMTTFLAAKNPADPNKVLRYVFPVAETGFDPVAVHDLYSGQVLNAVFDTLYTYDYLASPVKLVPRAAAELPIVSADDLTYTIRIKKGIYFYDDPVFKGKKRELTAADYIYSFKRLMDPHLRSPNNWLLDGRIEGMQQLIEDANKKGRFDYDRPISGLRAADRYTLVIKLNAPDHNFPMLLAHIPSGAVAREVIERYKDKSGYVMSHPVGTGPYYLSSWTPASRITLKANPNYAGFVWDFKASTPEDEKIVREMKGKKMPQIGVIDIRVIEEPQSSWLAFQKKQIDLMQLTSPMVPNAMTNGELKPELKKQGIQLSRIVDPSIDYFYWNMQNPVVGGLSKEKIALRRAMAMSFSPEQYIKIVFNGDAKRTQSPIPEGVVGYDPKYRTSIPYSVKAANLLLDKYHYKVGKDGWRTLPNGQPLVIEFTPSGTDSRAQQQAEYMKKSLAAIKINMTGKLMTFSDGLKAEKQCKTMFKTSAWIADYPDADNFMQLFYGKNIHASNTSCFKLTLYDQLFQQSQKLNDGPERDALYRKMSRLIEVYSPVQIVSSRYRNMLLQPHVLGYKKHPMLQSEWQYIDIAKQK